MKIVWEEGAVKNKCPSYQFLTRWCTYVKSPFQVIQLSQTNMKIQQSVTCFIDDWTYNGPVFLPKHHNNKTLNLNKITMKEITYKAVTGVVSLHLYFVSTPKWYILVPLEREPHLVTASYLFSWKCMCIHDQWIWHKHLQHVPPEL